MKGKYDRIIAKINPVTKITVKFIFNLALSVAFSVAIIFNIYI